jgi:uncharacterized protein YjiS (DUF1127 family)
MSTLSLHSYHSSHESRSLLLRAVEVLERWGERHRQRRALLDLSEDTLHDIGLSRADVYGEATKPFWRG